MHQEAEILEHRISDLFVERLDKTLNFPKTCPHGGVIPRDHHYKELYTTSILEFEPGDNVIVKECVIRQTYLYTFQVKISISAIR